MGRKSIKENKISELSEIKVDEKTRYWAKIALERMFEIWFILKGL